MGTGLRDIRKKKYTSGVGIWGEDEFGCRLLTCSFTRLRPSPRFCVLRTVAHDCAELLGHSSAS